MNFLTNGYGSVLAICSVGLALGLWTRQTAPTASPESYSEQIDAPKSSQGIVGFNGENAVTRDHFRVPRTVLGRVLRAESDLGGDAERVDSSYHDDRSRTEENFAGTRRSSSTIDMLPGIAQPKQTAEISASTDGPLWQLHVAEGDHVAAGTLLALIDNRISVASVAASQSAADRNAMLKSASAKVSLAEQYLNRIQQAASKKAASGLEVDEAHSRLAEAQAALQEGQEGQREAIARLKIEQAKLDAHEVRAPFSGIVIKIHKHLGESLARDGVLVSLAQTDQLRAELHIPISYVPTYRLGQKIRLKAELPESPQMDAVIVFVSPIIDAATQTVRTLVEIDNTEHHYPAGFAVRVSESTTE